MQKEPPKIEDPEAKIEVVYRDLYCGDFHFDGNEEREILKDIHIRNLYLDTTFCHPQYQYLSEIKLFKKIKNIIDEFMNDHEKEKEKENGNRICFMFGIKFIERLRLFIYLAKIYKEKVYVNKTKMRLINLLDFTNKDNKIFSTSYDDASIFQTTSVKNINFKNLNKILESDKECDKIIGIKLIVPKGKKTNIRKITKGNITLINIPYSEHCNFKELTQFINKIKPTKIIPTANFKESTKYIAKYF